MSDVIVSIRNVCKSFGAVEALKDVSIDIRSGEIFALLGPSGCGKSTLLRVISGFESPTSGELLLDGSDMTRLAPNKRPVNMVFQSYAVFPHMNVAENVAYGLKMEGVARDEMNERVQAALDQVHLGDLGKRKPDQLSGGQRQRVALARALVKRPRVLLLDEPLSALDAKLRDAMRLELVKLQETVGITFVIVTHDQSEAMAMADRVAVLESGRLRQVASPMELYQRPVDTFVADFIGSVHTFPVSQVSAQGTQLDIVADTVGDLQLDQPLPPGIVTGAQPEGAASVAIRPENIQVSLGEAPPGRIGVNGTLGDIAFQGQFSIIEIKRNGGNSASLTAVVDNASASRLQAATPEAAVCAHWAADDMLLLPRDATV